MNKEKPISLQLVESLGDNLSTTISSDVVYSLYYEYLELQKENEKWKDRDLIVAIELDKLQQENEKLNHYKLLYQKVKERNAKAIEFIEELYNNTDDITCYDIDRYRREELLDVLKGESYE